jgi:hypothetical protein
MNPSPSEDDPNRVLQAETLEGPQAFAAAALRPTVTATPPAEPATLGAP